MHIDPAKFLVVTLATAIATTSTWAGDNKSSQGAIMGVVTGENGKPFGGAEIRAQLVDTKKLTGITLTNSKGHYVLKGLPIGAYSITAYVDGTPVSRANIRTSNHGWANVNFDLRLNAHGADGVDRLQRDLRANGTTLSGGVTSGP